MSLSLGLGLGIHEGVFDDGVVYDWNFEHFANSALPAAFTFTRSGTTATYFNRLGLIQTTAANEPRIHRDPVGKRRGLLIETAATNLFLNSKLAGAPTSWTATETPTVAPSSIFGSGDESSAWVFAAEENSVFLTQNVSFADDTTYAISVYVEATDGGCTNEEVIGSTSLPVGCSVIDYLRNGVVVGGGDSVATGRLTVVVGGSYSGAAVPLSIGTGIASPQSATVTLSRPQIEAGDYPTSFIPTTVATATRNADLCIATGLALVSATGVLYAEATYLEASSAYGVGVRAFASMDANAVTNSQAIYNVAGVPTGRTQATTVQASVAVGSTLAASTGCKFALGFAAASVNAARNGSLGTPSGPVTMPTVTRLGVGTLSDGTLPINGLVHRVRIWSTRLTDAQLQSITK